MSTAIQLHLRVRCRCIVPSVTVNTPSVESWSLLLTTSISMSRWTVQQHWPTSQVRASALLRRWCCQLYHLYKSSAWGLLYCTLITVWFYSNI